MKFRPFQCCIMSRYILFISYQNISTGVGLFSGERLWIWSSRESHSSKKKKKKKSCRTTDTGYLCRRHYRITKIVRYEVLPSFSAPPYAVRTYRVQCVAELYSTTIMAEKLQRFPSYFFQIGRIGSFQVGNYKNNISEEGITSS